MFEPVAARYKFGLVAFNANRLHGERDEVHPHPEIVIAVINRLVRYPSIFEEIAESFRRSVVSSLDADRATVPVPNRSRRRVK